MKKAFAAWIGALVALMVLAIVSVVYAGESKYASGTTSAAVTFGPASSQLTVKGLYAVTDKSTASLKLYAWDKVKPESPTTAPAATNIIYVSNSDSQYGTSDKLVYVHSNGTVDYRTVSSATTSNVTLNAAISQAGTTSDKLYELTQVFQPDFDVTGAGVGTNKYGKFEGDVWVGLGPLYIVVDGTSNAVINATVK